MQKLKFIYPNKDGECSTRTLEHYTFMGRCVSGYCDDTGGYRTFRIDRIQSVIAGELPTYEELDRITKEQRDRHISSALEVCFTGFKAEQKQELTSIALQNGLVVRTSVTNYLDFLCCGYNAGPAKISRARQLGCVIVSERQFIELLTTGALPA